MEYGDLLELDFLSAYSPSGVPLTTVADDLHGLASGRAWRSNERLAEHIQHRR